MKYGHTLAQKSCPWSHESTNSLDHSSYFRYYYKLTLSELCSGLEKNYSFFPKIMFHWSWGYSRAYQNLASPYHTGDTYKLGQRSGKVVLEKKILTDDKRRTTETRFTILSNGSSQLLMLTLKTQICDIVRNIWIQCKFRIAKMWLHEVFKARVPYLASHISHLGNNFPILNVSQSNNVMITT